MYTLVKQDSKLKMHIVDLVLKVAIVQMDILKQVVLQELIILQVVSVHVYHVLQTKNAIFILTSIVPKDFIIIQEAAQYAQQVITVETM